MFAAFLAVVYGCDAATPTPERFATTPAKDAPSTAAPVAAWFEEVSDRLGLDFVHDAGQAPGGDRFPMPQSMGSGCALWDFDNDGRLDLYLIHNGGPEGRRNQLFRQLEDGRFADVSAGSGLDVAGYGMGAAAGDVNNDGQLDIVVTEYGGTRLLLNRGQGKFTDVSAAAGIDNPGWGTSASFLDYDRDGWLDLVVVNYVDYDPTKKCQDADGRYDYCSPQAFPPSMTRLYRNVTGVNGSNKTPVAFVNTTVESHLSQRLGPGLGVLCADFDNDHWPDILIADDGKPNRLFINLHDGTFREAALPMGLAYNRMGDAEASMGIAVGDVDGDGAFDLFITHLTHETPTLWRQVAAGLFEDRTPESGLLRSHWRGTGFGTVFADFDCDGDLDLASVNGRVRRAPTAVGEIPAADAWQSYTERNQLLVNDGRGSFQDVSPGQAAYCGEPGIGRALAAGDLDNDGAIDLVATYVAGEARIYRNRAPDRGHWLSVRAYLPEQRRDAYGARVDVYASGRSWTRCVLPGSSYLVSHDPRMHFGLGHVDQIDELRVVWPDGVEEFFAGGPADRQIVLNYGEGTASRTLPAKSGQPLVSATPPAAALPSRLKPLVPRDIAPLTSPPSLDLRGVDREVVVAVAARREKLLAAPDSVQAWGELGMTLMAHDFTPAAVVCFQQAEARNPNDPRWPYYQGIALSGVDAFEALAKLRRAAELDRDETDSPRLRLAELQLAEGFVDDARDSFQGTLDRRPDNVRAALGMARVESRRGDLGAGVRWAQRALTDPRSRRGAAELLAQFYTKQGDLVAAESAKRQANALPQDAPWPDPLYEEVQRLRAGAKSALSRATRLIGQGRHSDALPELLRAVEERPEHDYGWTLLGLCQLKQGDAAGAEQSFRRSLALEPESVLTQFQLGMSLTAQNRWEDASRSLREAIVLKPDFALGHYQLGMCRRRLGDRAGAIAAQQDAVRCQPNFVMALVELGKLLGEDGQIDRAAEYLKRALLIDPRNAEAAAQLRTIEAK